MLEETKKRLNHFNERTYKEYETVYKDLEYTQHPHTLFITCSDSRILPEKLMNLNPGEVFAIRNIANTVPAADSRFPDAATISAVEFAVEVLNVKQIIVCGHSNCGGCGTVLSGLENIPHLPYTQSYLSSLKSTKKEIEPFLAGQSAETQARRLEQQNVIVQLQHLKEYGFIQDRLKKGTLLIEGWHYTIGSGDIMVYDEQDGDFALFSKSTSVARP